MKSIAEIFDNGNQMIDSIHYFFDRYIGNKLLRKCRISKIVDKIINKALITRLITEMFRAHKGINVISNAYRQ